MEEVVFEIKDVAGLRRGTVLLRLPRTTFHVILLAFLSVAFLTAVYQIRSSVVTIDPGEKTDQNGLVGFYDRERNPDFSYRWSQGTAYISLPNMPPQPYRISITLFGGPASVPDRTVAIWANNAKLGEIKAGHRLDTFSFDYSPTLNDTRLIKLENLVIAINTDPFQEPGKLRQLGVMVNSVKVEPLVKGAALPPIAQIPTVIALVFSFYGLVLGVGRRRLLSLSVGFGGLALGMLIALYRPDWVIRSVFFLANEPLYVAIALFLTLLVLAFSWCPERFLTSRLGIATYLVASLAVAVGWYWLGRVGLGQNGAHSGDLYASMALWAPIVAAIFSSSYAAAFALGLTRRANRAVVFDLLTYLAIGLLLLYPVWQTKRVVGWDDGVQAYFLQLAAIFVGIVALRAFLLLNYLISNALVAPISETKLRAIVLIGSLAVLLSLAGWESGARILQSDEPSYLIATHSLVRDGDLNLENNYANGDGLNFYPGRLAFGDWQNIRGPNGEIYPGHELGISFAVAPGYLLGGKLGVELELAILAAGLLVSLYSLCRDVGCSIRASLYTWLLVAFTSPFLVYSFQVYPEIIGALLLTVALRSLCIQEKTTWHQLLLGVISLALMPWFHPRFWLLVAGVVPFAVRPLLKRRISLIVFGLLGLAMVGVFVVFGKVIYNVALPNAAVFAAGGFRGFFSPAGMVPRMLGLLFDRTVGLFPTGPIYLLVPLGLLFLFRRERHFVWPLLSAFIVYFLVNSAKGLWYGGWVPPARYLVCLTPVFAVGLGVAIDELRGKVAKWLVRGLAALSFAVAFILTMIPVLRYFDPLAHTSTLNRFLRHVLHFDPGAIFPNFLTPQFTREAYVMGLSGLGLVVVITVVTYRMHSIPVASGKQSSGLNSVSVDMQDSGFRE